MKCVILGAGYATRLYPLTRDRPKPLLPVGGLPIIQRILDRVVQVPGLDRIYVVSNHRFVDHYRNWLREYSSDGAPKIPIEIYDDTTTSEEDRLGAVGDIQFVIEHAGIQEDLLVVAGDNLMEFSLVPFAEAAARNPVTVGLKDLGSPELVSMYGAVTVDESNRIVEFEEKPPRPETSLISIGLYAFGGDQLEWIQRFLKESGRGDQPGHLIQWLISRVDVQGVVMKGEWFDIGDIDSYNRANEKYST